MAKGFKISFHKSSQQACLVVNKKRIYLGKWPNWPGEPPARVVDEFNRQVAKVAGEGKVTRLKVESTLILSELAALWITWARGRYSNPQTADDLRRSLSTLLVMFGREPASSIGPRKIADYQKRLAKEGRTRQGILKSSSHVRQMFAWATAQELIDPTQLVAIRSMQPLRHGAIAAPESAIREPVAIEVMRATLPHLSATVQDMVRIQALTGMRPAEVCELSMGEIDPVSWVYSPAEHKMAHLGRRRVVPLIGEAIAIIKRHDAGDGSPVFSPARCVDQWRDEKRAKRKSKVQPSQLDRSKDDPKVAPGDRYTTNTYRRAIQRACARARKLDPTHPTWSPNQLRKLAAQSVADAVGLDAARALLGHADGAITRRHYAVLDLDRARHAAEQLAKVLS